MKAHKGFDKDLKCRGFQYEVGKQYEEEEAELCSAGFHACENPMDVLGYYAPADSRYCEVEIDPTDEKDASDSKRVSKSIKVNREIGLPGLIKAGIEYISSKVDWETAASTSTGNYSASTNTGNYSASTNTGNCSASTNTGNHSASTVSGNNSIAIAVGYKCRAKGSLGCYIVLAERDDEGKILRVRSHKVDGKSILPDMWYTLSGGRFVKVN